MSTESTAGNGQPYKVEPYKTGYETRYRILVEDAVVDDAQGYGYKTAAKAHTAWHYKHGGKEQQQNKTRIAKAWLKSVPGLQAEFDELVEWNIKEIALGEYSFADIFELLEQKHSVLIPAEVRWFLKR